ncbi:MAG TPA: GspH/FimT family protein [Phycisphaerae bacterium]|nr:GspH/FimT family protein [Phycisphaerae bacterium]HOJ74235.1 GspH/FimT family protein [Phycisphaerae bacterium]HOM51314.1 GspH/FimT family protein [Phycisphaerae bacterium]HON65122.1 GspH/FimT family protein [Phycisphaerae bacterium]HOQ86177.1 GspH/FimT family protein [Phycisphaerae bacterium]
MGWRLRTTWSSEQAGALPLRRTAGFSLLELILVLVVIAVMASIGLARLSRSPAHHQLTAAARRVAADLDLARQQAVALGTTRQVRFDKSASTYALEGVADINRPDKPYVVDLTLPPYGVAIKNVDLDGAGGSVLAYDAHGRPVIQCDLAEAELKIVLAGQSRNVRITIDASTGRAYVEE